VRAVLITNPFATTSGGWTKDVIVRSLEAQFDLQIQFTEYRMHAAEIAQQARKDNFDAVITLGGDGTINEVINGLLDPEVSKHPQPLLAPIPGGLANVFPRSIGFSSDAVLATGQVIEAVEQNHSQLIPLGKMNDRWFSFNAGLGLDAGIVATMESLRAEGKKASPSTYLLASLKHYFQEADTTNPHLTVENFDGQKVEDVFMVIVQNAAPWIYIGSVAIDFSPDASYKKQLDAVALTALSPTSIATYITEAAARIPTEKRTNSVWLKDTGKLIVTSNQPIAAQVDGDLVGDLQEAIFTHHPDALRVAVPLLN
jgi:diacylglycerol kinase family enzyme